MKKVHLNIKLLLTLLVILAGTIGVNAYYKQTPQLPWAAEMRKASERAQHWFKIIEQAKTGKGIFSDSESKVPNAFMIGNDWSCTTTSLGSLEAKETSTNPDFAALVVRMLHESGIKKSDTIGVTLSGSFPALGISVLAALQTIGNEVVLISSLGASTYGANQEEATWLDMENWLIEKGGLKYRSEIVSMGGEQDVASWLTEEGRIAFRLASNRNHTDLYFPDSIEESIQFKTDIFLKNHISLLINVGGNISCVGNCSHAISVPNGLNLTFETCDDPDRGIIARLNEKGIPFIHFLNIRDIATRYGMDIAPGNEYIASTNLYTTPPKSKTLPMFILLISIIPVIILKRSSS